jgi:hypothetical protein
MEQESSPDLRAPEATASAEVGELSAGEYVELF